MSPHVSKIARSIGDSAVVGMRRQADALETTGMKVIDFGAGEPDFDVPPPIKEAALRAIRENRSHYIDPRGLAELRDEIARFETEEQNRTISSDQVVVTPGALGALSLATRAVRGPGDEALILEPRWGPYQNLVLLTGAMPVGVPMNAAKGRFLIDAERLAAAATPRTRVLIVNTPWNPTGRVLSPTELADVAEVAKRHDLWIIADEVYRGMVFDGAGHVSVASLDNEVTDRTLITTSLSKTFAMTGWRLGYCIAPNDIAQLLGRMNHCSTRCASSIVQHAAVTAFRDGAPFVNDMLEEYTLRRDAVVAGLNRIDGVVCPVPEGTFYAFPQFAADWGDSNDVADYILQEAGVIVTPGSAYGAGSRHHLRLSFAASMTAIEEGLLRLQEALPKRYG
jgi:aspartate/methionine/tyrosine aminotransferase